MYRFGYLLHLALYIADDRDRDTLDEDIITAAAQGLHIEPRSFGFPVTAGGCTTWRRHS